MTFNRKLDEELELHARTWILDGDLYRCAYCHRGHLASKAAEKFVHASGCKASDFASDHPWLDLARMTAALVSKVEADKVKQVTYISTQATNCAGCGQHKHTPLRVDAMDGYVCLTCIDNRLEALLNEECARNCEKEWEGCERVAELPSVQKALKAFSVDPTDDAGVRVVKAVIKAIG
jgi:hypothetical protein